MAKGYWITFYHSVRDPARLAEYGALAVPAIEAGGGRFLSRGPAARTFEGVEKQRTVLVEFDSVARAVQTYQSPQYQAALVLLKGAVERAERGCSRTSPWFAAPHTPRPRHGEAAPRTSFNEVAAHRQVLNPPAGAASEPRAARASVGAKRAV